MPSATTIGTGPRAVSGLGAALTILAIGFSLCAGFAGRVEAQAAMSVDGIIESTSGGFKFPDGTVQVTAGAFGSVNDTGQQMCWDAAGSPRPCATTGEDGELQSGVDWPTPRFTDNTDGTVTDNLTGLMWLQDAGCPTTAPMLWQPALDWVDSLNTTSIACTNYIPMTYTDWRLPNILELISLVDFGQSSPALPLGHPFLNVTNGFYYSSTTSVVDPTAAWAINLDAGDPSDGAPNGKTTFLDHVWPVRGGQ